MIRIANAPCSWGALEFEATDQPAPASQVLDEMAAAGYDGTERVAAEVRDATGLRTVFHHHCAGYVETTEEIDALPSRTDPALWHAGGQRRAQPRLSARPGPVKSKDLRI